VIEGKLFRDTEAVGEMDPFILIEYKGKKFQTKVHEEGGKNPKWN
jgi:Ca2+-dependent lipid-binding protein